MKFRDFFSKRQFFFALFLFVILIPIALWDSNTQVKVTLDSDSITVRSDRYSLSVGFDQIASAELSDLASPGEKVVDGFDDDILRCGVWMNEVWGEYYIVADLDTSNCVVLHLEDGRTFVFSCKDDETTASYYEQLLPYLS